MKYQYGEIVLETKDYSKALDTFLECKKLGYSLGDYPEKDVKNNTSYVLVVNDENYIDVEYRIPVIETTIVTKEEYYKLKDTTIGEKL